MKVFFDTKNIYYLPQYLPIYRQLIERGHEVSFICYQGKNLEYQIEPLLERLALPIVRVEASDQAIAFYLKEKADWVFFGNRTGFLDQLHGVSRSVQLGHGVGPKPAYYHKSSTPMTVRFIEGEMRLKTIQAMYPNDNFVQVGFSKLDPLVQGVEPGLDYDQLGLDKTRQTILYAPTYNPSSIECFPDDWPEKFADYNILVKAHSLTYTRRQYRGQMAKLDTWSQYSNVHVAGPEELSIVPYLKDSDILLSDASSTLFEFAALDRPVIVCDFYKLKWLYRGPFRYRFDRRFNRDNVIYKGIGRHIKSFGELSDAVKDELACPERFHDSRVQYTRDHVGSMDGKASERIVDYLENYRG